MCLFECCYICIQTTSKNHPMSCGSNCLVKRLSRFLVSSVSSSFCVWNNHCVEDIFGPLSALYQPQNSTSIEFEVWFPSNLWHAVLCWGSTILFRRIIIVSSRRKSLKIPFWDFSSVFFCDTRCALYFEPFYGCCSLVERCQIRWQETCSLSVSICSLLWLINRIVKFIPVPAGLCFLTKI